MSKPPQVTVLGSLNMDISVTVPRLPGPGATVLGDAARFTPGGKGANQAVAAARLGAQVRMIGAVGDDDFGRQLTEALRAEHIEARGVTVIANVPTGLAMITVDATGENIITVAPGANHHVSQNEAGRVAGHDYDALVISAEIPVPVIRAALKLASSTLCILNLAPARPEAAAIVADGVDWLVVNESEAAAVLGRPVGGLADARQAAVALTAAGARNAVVTAGPHGVAAAGEAIAAGGKAVAAGGNATTAAPDTAAAPGEAITAAGKAIAASGKAVTAPDTAVAAGSDGAGAGPEAVTIAGFSVTAVDSVGAGDTFVGALAVTLAAGVPVLDALRAAAAAGAAAVTRPGAQAAMPEPADILAATGHRWPLP